MTEPERIYLDHAATSFPKPEPVLAAMLRYATRLGASPGRGGYAEAVESAATLSRCRARLCELFGGVSPEHVVFTLNCTDALNLAIHGTVGWWRRHRPEAPVHLVTTAMDHNSVLRPFEQLRGHGVEITRVGADREGVVDPAEVADALRPETRLVAMVHASNVTGTLQDVGAVGRACREKGVPLLVDAAQSLGHVPVDVGAMGIDMLAFPGHKGLMGPLGTGGLYIRPGLEGRIEPVRQGGTGSRSEQDTQPTEMPDRYESGSHNTIGIVGLLAGVEWLLERTLPELRTHEVRLIETFLHHMPGEELGFRLHGPTDPARRVGVFAITHERLTPAELAGALEARAGVLGRAGLHCAPGAHDSIGTTASGGACRLSVGPMTTADQVRAACACLGEIASAGGASGRAARPQDERGSSIQPASV
ncbi:MAG: aminotransferase class V-fold PLP-dependent enzyme [Phycisphaerales bacterium JB054]